MKRDEKTLCPRGFQVYHWGVQLTEDSFWLLLMVSLPPYPHVTWQEWAEALKNLVRHILNVSHLSHVSLCLLEQMFSFAPTHLCFY